LALEKIGSTPVAFFWAYLDQLVATSLVKIDRPGRSQHPRYPEIIYPLDYGYLEGTGAVDGGGVDVWLGSSGVVEITAAILTVDLHKRDVEIKILLGCSKAEMQRILNFHNQTSMRALLVRRPINEEATHENNA
jgi:inorganic pyrophosphatase